MKSRGLRYAVKTLIPCIAFAGTAGIITGALIFLFKVCSTFIIKISKQAYGFVQDNPVYLPLLLAALAVIAFIASILLKWEPSCKGGGIPTSTAILRGLITFNWLKNVIILFASAMLTYLGGVPLGIEGPSVQIGTAAGRGTVRVFGKKNRAWDRYIMTGGACAGFAAATGAPISGILFSLEEAHRRFSPMIFMTSASAVIAGSITAKKLCEQFGVSYNMFHLPASTSLPMHFLWSALIVGAICALVAIAFTMLYRKTFSIISTKLAKIPLALKFVVIFVIIGVLGFASEHFLGSGHDIIDLLLEGHGVWYMILLYLCVRAIVIIVSNNAGITGGLFVPSLAFGAMIGAICGKVMVSLNILPAQHFAIIVIIGMTSYISASSRTPLTAIVFAVEALSCYENILPIATGVVFAYIIIESLGVPAFSEVVIESRVETMNHGKNAMMIKTSLTVQKNAFIVGKEIRDILWPPTCVVTSVEKAPGATGSFTASGDILHLHYMTYDNAETMSLLEALLGDQPSDDGDNAEYRQKKNNDLIPEL